jgi:hypothetical protein
MEAKKPMSLKKFLSKPRHEILGQSFTIIDEENLVITPDIKDKFLTNDEGKTEISLGVSLNDKGELIFGFTDKSNRKNKAWVEKARADFLKAYEDVQRLLAEKKAAEEAAARAEQERLAAEKAAAAKAEEERLAAEKAAAAKAEEERVAAEKAEAAALLVEELIPFDTMFPDKGQELLNKAAKAILKDWKKGEGKDSVIDKAYKEIFLRIVTSNEREEAKIIKAKVKEAIEKFEAKKLATKKAAEEEENKHFVRYDELSENDKIKQLAQLVFEDWKVKRGNVYKVPRLWIETFLELNKSGSLDGIRKLTAIRKKVFDTIFDIPLLDEKASPQLQALHLQLLNSKSTLEEKFKTKSKKLIIPEVENYVPFKKAEEDVYGYIPLELLKEVDGLFYVPKAAYEEALKLKATGFTNFNVKNPMESEIGKQIVAAERIRRKFRESVSAEETADEKKQTGTAIIPSSYPEMKVLGKNDSDMGCGVCMQDLDVCYAYFKLHGNEGCPHVCLPCQLATIKEPYMQNYPIDCPYACGRKLTDYEFYTILRKYKELVAGKSLPENRKPETIEAEFNKLRETIRKRKETNDTLQTLKNKRNSKLNIEYNADTFSSTLKKFYSQKEENSLAKTAESQKLRTRLAELKAEKDALENPWKVAKQRLAQIKRGDVYGQIETHEQTLYSAHFTKGWSICPYCLSSAERASGCQIMTHNGSPCSLRPGPVKEIMSKYPPPPSGVQEWCAVCSSPGANHGHYRKYQPNLYPAQEYFNNTAGGTSDAETTCCKNGGFGGKEFIARKIAIRETLISLLNRNIYEQNNNTRRELAIAAENAAINMDIYLLQYDPRFRHRQGEIPYLRNCPDISVPNEERGVTLEKRDKEAKRLGEMVNRIFNGQSTIQAELPFNVIEPPKPERIAILQREIETLEAELRKSSKNLPMVDELGELLDRLEELNAQRSRAVGEDADMLDIQIESLRDEIRKKEDEKEEDVSGRDDELDVLKGLYGLYDGGGKSDEEDETSFISLFERASVPQEIIETSLETCELRSSTSKQSAGRKNKTQKRRHKKSKKTRGKHFTN